MDGLWIATSLTADTNDEVRITLTATLNAHTDKLCDTLIKGCKWVGLNNLALKIKRHECGLNVVTREAKASLGEVVSTEGEEVCVLSNLLRHDSCTWELNHGTNWDVELNTVLVSNLLDGLLNLFTDLDELLFEANQRNHDLWARVKTNTLELCSCACDSANLHNVELWVDKTKAAATEAEHWVCLLEGVKLSEKSTLCSGVLTLLLIMSNLNVKLTWGIKELMQWWVKKTDNNVFAVHYLEHTKEVTLLSTAKLLNSKLLNILRVCKDKVLNEVLTLTKEHVLSTVKTNCLSAVINGSLSICWVISVCTYANDATTGLVKADLICPCKDGLKVTRKLWLDKLNSTKDDVTSGTVDGDNIALVNNKAGISNGEALVSSVNTKCINTADTRSAHTTSNNSCVAGLAAVGS